MLVLAALASLIDIGTSAHLIAARRATHDLNIDRTASREDPTARESEHRVRYARCSLAVHLNLPTKGGCVR
jgi:hypothetical protein